jgi:hypothetical protein
MKRLLLALSLFFAIPVSASEITSKIVDSVQLTVQGAAVQSTKNWSSRMVSLEQILHLRHLVALLVLEHMILIPQVRHSVSQKVITAADSVVTSLSLLRLELLLLLIFIVMPLLS